MAASEEAPSEPLKYKTWVLRVSIHCEGCKKKVKKILQSIDDVYTVDVDALQNKVTVTGNVEAETLIRKLMKSNKHADLWPEKKPTNPSSGSNSNKKSGSGGNQNQNQSKESTKSKEPNESSDVKPSPAGGKPAADANKKSEGKAEEAPGGKPAKPSKAGSEASKSADKEPEANTGESSDSAPEKAANPANGEKASSGGGGGGKKKGKKENSSGGAGESVAKEAGGNNNSEAGAGISPLLPPHMYHYPMYPHQPAYVMSYNMAHPSTSQAYYAPPMPPVSQGYMYAPYPPPPEFYYGPLESSSSAPPPPSYDGMFSDENPNSCNLM